MKKQPFLGAEALHRKHTPSANRRAFSGAASALHSTFVTPEPAVTLYSWLQNWAESLIDDALG